MKQFVALLFLAVLFASQAAVGGTVSNSPDQPFATVNGQPVTRALFQNLMQETSAWLGDKGLQRDLAAHNFYPTSTSIAAIDWSTVSPYERNQMAASLLELKDLKAQKLELSNLAQKLQAFRTKYAALTTALRQKATMQTVPKGSTTSIAAAAAPGTAVTMTDDEASSADIAVKKQTGKKTTAAVNRSHANQWKAATRSDASEPSPPSITIYDYHCHPFPFPSLGTLNLSLTTRERFELELLLQAVFRQLEGGWAEAPYPDGRAERQRLFNVYFEALALQLRHRNGNRHQLQTIKEELLSLRRQHDVGNANLITKEVARMVKYHTTSLGPIQGSLARLKQAARRPLLIYEPRPWVRPGTHEINLPPMPVGPPGALAPSAPVLARSPAAPSLAATATLSSRLRRLTLLWPAPRRVLPVFLCLASGRAEPLARSDPSRRTSPLPNPAPAGFFRFRDWKIFQDLRKLSSTSEESPRFTRRHHSRRSRVCVSPDWMARLSAKHQSRSPHQPS